MILRRSFLDLRLIFYFHINKIVIKKFVGQQR
nr:MAG TPA: hypothetical protein [Caudoviricetes sp.]